MNEKLGKRFSEDEREAMNFRFRVACFTDTYTNPLMWDHYANSHTGFCVGYLKFDIKDICDKFELVKKRQLNGKRIRELLKINISNK